MLYVLRYRVSESSLQLGLRIHIGLSCTLLWKAVGIVLALWTLYYGFKAIKWALTVRGLLVLLHGALIVCTQDAPTGLEEMPEFGTSLGCSDAPYIYNGTEQTFMIPIAARNGASTAFDIRGGSIGTILIADGAPDATEIKYTMTLRSTSEALVQKVHFAYPETDASGTVTRSRLIVDTPYLTAADAGHCMRHDVTVFLPPTLRQLHVQARALAHVSFAPGTTASSLDQLLVTLFALDSRNILVPSASVVARAQRFDVYRGYVVGEATIVEELDIETQRGDAIANVKIAPAAPTDPEHPKTAILRTASGGGRSDFVYLGSKAFTRNIQARHSASKNADMYLTYTGADVNGKVELVSKSFTLTGARSLSRGPGSVETGDWTHFVGNKDGGDEIRVDSRGWTGLYF